MQVKAKTYIRKFAGDAVDLGTWQPPTRRRVTDDGDILIEKLPSAPHVLMLKPGGGAHNVQVANGMGRPRANDPYKNAILAEKMSGGFLPYGRCPKLLGLHRFLAKDIQDSAPCTKDPDGHIIDDEHPCACIIKTQARRRGVQDKSMAALEARMKSQDTRKLEAAEGQTAALIDAVQTLAAKVDGKDPSRSKKGSGE